MMLQLSPATIPKVGSVNPLIPAKFVLIEEKMLGKAGLTVELRVLTLVYTVLVLG